MKKVRLVVWAPRAKKDLTELWQYYARVASIEVADRMTREIAARAGLLERDPLPGRDREELRAGLRSLLAHPYTIFYRVSGERAEIARVLHERRDFFAALQDADD